MKLPPKLVIQKLKWEFNKKKEIKMGELELYLGRCFRDDFSLMQCGMCGINVRY